MTARKLLRATRGGGGEERGRKGEAVAKHRELGKNRKKRRQWWLCVSVALCGGWELLKIAFKPFYCILTTLTLADAFLSFPPRAFVLSLRCVFIYIRSVVLLLLPPKSSSPPPQSKWVRGH